MNKPTVLHFDSIGNSSLGYISVGEESKNIPFSIKRVYWTYFTPQDVTRGGHANIEKELVLIAVSGIITVTTEMPDGSKETFLLDHPSKGLYIPYLCWHTMQYSHNAVQMVIASNLYNEDDYIRDYDLYLKWK
jgi:hypothetical protein